MQFFNSYTNPFKLLGFVIFSAIFFGAITYKLILLPDGPVHEFNAHVFFAVQMSQEGRIVIPHFLFQILTFTHHNLIEFFNLPTHEIAGRTPVINYDWGFSAFIVMLEIYVGILLLLFAYFKLRFQNYIGNFENAAYLVAFGVSICSPIFLLAPIDGKYYLGYISPSTIYIIPTQVLLKLPSLALFLISPYFFAKEKGGSLFLFAVVLLVFLSGLAKPNWLMVMIPALGMITLVKIIQNNHVNWVALCLTFVSSAVVLGWQFYFKFIDATSPVYKSHLKITAPFEVLRNYSDFVFIKIFLSVSFPLYITILFWGNIRKDFHVQYAWLLFLIGLIYTGFIGEEPYLMSGNFIWSGQIACFMLFVAASALFFSEIIVENVGCKKKILLGVSLFCSHVVCGLIYYFRSFDSPLT